MRLNIRSKLLLWIGAPFALVAGGLLWLDYHSLRAAAFRATEGQLAEAAARCAGQLDGRFEAAAQVARTTAAVLNTHVDLQETDIYSALDAILEHNPGVYGACYAYMPGLFRAERQRFAPYVCRDGSALRRLDIADAYDYTAPEWEWFVRPRDTGQAAWTEPYFDEGAGNVAMVTFSTPFFRERRLTGVATVDLRLEDLREHLRVPAELPDARWSITSRAGRLITADEAAFVLHETLFTIAEKRERPELAEVARRMVAGLTGSAVIRDVDGPAGPSPGRGSHRPDRVQGSSEPRLLFFTPIPSTGWSFSVHLPQAHVMAPVYEQLRRRTLGLLAAALALLLLVLGLGFWITRPAPRLAAAMRALSTGDFTSQVSGVHTRDEFGELADGFNRMVEQLSTYVGQLTAATAARQAVESELRIAREIQLSLLPRTFPPFPDRPEFALHGVNASAKQVAGDFFDFYITPDDLLNFVIADVSGKGVPAALFMAVTRTMLRNLSTPGVSPATVLMRCNELLRADNPRMMFVTIFLGTYDIQTGVLHYGNAGHPPPYRIAAGGAVSVFGQTTGPLLGVLPQAEYEEATDVLAPGEALVLFTDGVIEAESPSGELYRDERFAALLAEIGGRPAQELCDEIIHRLDDYQAGRRGDDTTLLVLRRNN